jgi:hypothetical protein
MKNYAWVVEVLLPHGHYVFETRREARMFAKAQTAGPAYVFKAYWGRR